MVIRPTGVDTLHIPDYSDANPYQRELQQGLATEGTTVTIADGNGLFPVVNATRDAGWPDIVHLHWLHPYLIGQGTLTTLLKGSRLLFELLLLRLLGVQLAWTIHNDIEHERRAPAIERVAKHCVFRLCGAVFVHCDAAKPRVLRTFRLPSRYDARMTVVPHGNYIETYDDDAGRESLELDEERAEMTFLYFGQIRPYKNVPALIDTFQSLDLPDAELLIVGNPSSTRLQATIERRCRNCESVQTMLEFVPEATVSAYFELADVVVLPYDEILTSGTVVLAMSQGKPVVAPEVGCAGSLLATTGEEAGSLSYDPEEPGGLAAALRRALTAELASISRQDQALIQKHDWQLAATMTQQGYERAIAPTSPPARLPSSG